MSLVLLTRHTPVCTPYDISVARCQGSNNVWSSQLLFVMVRARIERKRKVPATKLACRSASGLTKLRWMSLGSKTTTIVECKACGRSLARWSNSWAVNLKKNGSKVQSARWNQITYILYRAETWEHYCITEETMIVTHRWIHKASPPRLYVLFSAVVSLSISTNIKAILE